MRKLWELKSAIDDAAASLTQAAKYAFECSGHEPGQDADPEHGVPAIEPIEGWPAMLKLYDLLIGLKIAVEASVPPEVAKAIKEEADEDADREHPSAYGL